MAIKSFIKKIKTVFSPYIENYDPPEPDPDKEGLDIEIEAVPFNHRHQGNTTPKISHNDLINVAATQHHSNSNDPTTDQKAAMTGANSPDAGNVFATMADAGAGGQTLYDAIVAPSGGDYTTIQAAIDAGHTTIFVRNGTYNITSAITLTDKCQIVGESKEETIIDAGGNNIVAIHAEGSNFYQAGTIAITKNSTTVTGTGTVFTSAMVGRQILIDGKLYQIATYVNSSTITIETAYEGKNISTTFYYIADNLSVRISNIAVSNVGSGNGIIYCKYVKDSRFENLRLYDNLTTSGCFHTTYFINNIIKDCQMGKGQAGMLLDDYSISNCVQRNVISKITTGSGITIQGGNSKYNQIIDNNFSFNNSSGIYLLQGKYNIITNNICNNNNTGIDIYGSADFNQISNNEIKYNYYTGIKIDQSYYCLVNNNYLYDNNDNNDKGAIWIYKGANHLINGNRIYLSNYGIYVVQADRDCITGNYIYDPDSHGIFLDNSTNNNALTVNYIYQAGAYGIRVEGTENFVHGNYFLTCASGGLLDVGVNTIASDNVTT